jgi:hypothetical protein
MIAHGDGRVKKATHNRVRSKGLLVNALRIRPADVANEAEERKAATPRHREKAKVFAENAWTP